MFDQVLIRNCNVGENLIDAGLIAETLIFYDKVHILFDHGTLVSSLRSIGLDNILYLLNNRIVSASFLLGNFATYTEAKNQIPVHRFINFSLHKHADGRKAKKEDGIYTAFDAVYGNSRQTRMSAEKFMERLSFRQPGSFSSIPDQATSDLNDSQYVTDAIEMALRRLVPSYSLPHGWYFQIVRTEQGFFVSTNLDYDQINAEYHKLVSPKHSTIGSAFLVSHILSARGDMCFAADYMSELVTNPVSSDLIRAKFGAILQRRLRSSEAISAFQDMRLSNTRALREAINSGERSFDEFLKLLDKAHKFKEWLRVQNPDENLLKAYIEESFRETVFDRLPSKAIRFAVFSLAGIGAEAIAPSGIGIAAGLGIGAFDSFLLDKLIGGWRPSHFVEGPLRAFVDT